MAERSRWLRSLKEKCRVPSLQAPRKKCTQAHVRPRCTGSPTTKVKEWLKKVPSSDVSSPCPSSLFEKEDVDMMGAVFNDAAVNGTSSSSATMESRSPANKEENNNHLRQVSTAGSLLSPLQANNKKKIPQNSTLDHEIVPSRPGLITPNDVTTVSSMPIVNKLSEQNTCSNQPRSTCVSKKLDFGLSPVLSGVNEDGGNDDLHCPVDNELSLGQGLPRQQNDMEIGLDSDAVNGISSATLDTRSAANREKNGNHLHQGSTDRVLSPLQANNGKELPQNSTLDNKTRPSRPGLITPNDVTTFSSVPIVIKLSEPNNCSNQPRSTCVSKKLDFGLSPVLSGVIENGGNDDLHCPVDNELSLGQGLPRQQDDMEIGLDSDETLGCYFISDAIVDIIDETGAATSDEVGIIAQNGNGNQNLEVNDDSDADDEVPPNIAIEPSRTAEKKKTRKRQRNTQDWRVNATKRNYRSGKEYTNSKGKVVPEKKMGAGCNLNCRFKCQQRVTEAQRQNVFDNFYKKRGALETVWNFMIHHVKKSKTAVERDDEDNSRRKHTYQYHFTVNGELIKVCKTMFLSTLQISNSVVETAHMKLIKGGTGTISPCKIGKHSVRPNAIKPSVKESVREHIDNFPKVESHYIRKDSSRQYVEERWDVAKMHRAYVKWMKEKKKTALAMDLEEPEVDMNSIPFDILSDVTSDGELENDEESDSDSSAPVPEVKDPDIASYKQYLHIFNTEYNISHHKPKKDQCELCCEYADSPPEHRAIIQDKYDLHIKLKNHLRVAKENDKKATESDPSLAFCCFDLQKILYVPQGKSTGFYYNSKLSTYNFTVFETRSLKCNKGYCFTWQEGICKKGSNEVASCLLIYIRKAVARGVKEFNFWADNCTGQNKNRMIFALLVYASALFEIKISLNFLQKGHTQNEGDNMHANIENASKGVKLYLPSHWRKVMRSAMVKPEDKYEVIKLDQSNCFDFKGLVGKQNWNIAENKEEIRVSEVRKVEVSDGEKLIITYDLLSEEGKHILNVNRRKGRPVVAKTFQFQRAYNQKLPISASTRTGLQKMIDSNAIPLKYQGFYVKLLSDHPPA